jgi:hypothetical protein
MLTGVKAQMLQALRAGNLSAAEIGERWPSGHSNNMSLLVGMGYAEPVNETEYRITALGRDNCPNRNPLLNQLIEDKPKMEAKSNIVEKPKSKVLQILEYIEQHPNCLGSEPNKALGLTGIDGFLYSYMNKGLVTKKGTGRESRYKLADSLTAIDVLTYRYREKDAQASTAAPVVKTDTDYQISTKSIDWSNLKREDIIADTLNDSAKIELNTSNFEPPKFLDNTWAKPATEPAQSGNFRVAYTNDGCLMLLGLQYAAIELNAAQTNDLLNFISETITPIGVAI